MYVVVPLRMEFKLFTGAEQIVWIQMEMNGYISIQRVYTLKGIHFDVF